MYKCDCGNPASGHYNFHITNRRETRECRLLFPSSTVSFAIFLSPAPPNHLVSLTSLDENLLRHKTCCSQVLSFDRMTLSPLFFFFTLLFGLKVSLVTADWMYLMPVYPSQQQQEQSMQSHMLATDPYSYYHVPHQPANDHQQIPAPLIVLLPTQTARTPIIPDQQEDMIEQRSSLPFLESAAKATVRSSPTNVKVGGSGFWSFLRGTSLNNDVADRLFPFTIRIATHGEPHMP